MAGIKFNYKEIYRSLATSEAGAKRVNTVVQNKFLAVKGEFLEDFENHSVTREIESKEGDLYGFLGFERDSDPITPVRNVLEKDLKVISSNKAAAKSNSVEYRFSLRVPTEEIKAASPLPWEEDAGWAVNIEKNGGIAGFAHFLRGIFDKNPNSLSKRGLQSENDLGKGEFKKRPYLTELFNKLIERIRNL